MEKELQEIIDKQNKIINLLTKIAKTLYLIPCSEKEAKDIRLTRTKNMKADEKSYKDLEEMKSDNYFKNFLDDDIYSSKEEVYKGIVGSDLLGGGS